MLLTSQLLRRSLQYAGLSLHSAQLLLRGIDFGEASREAVARRSFLQRIINGERMLIESRV